MTIPVFVLGTLFVGIVTTEDETSLVSLMN